jgi:hypothetical protein
MIYKDMGNGEWLVKNDQGYTLGAITENKDLFGYTMYRGWVNGEMVYRGFYRDDACTYIVRHPRNAETRS